MGILKKIGRFIVHSIFMSSIFSLSLSVFADDLSKVDSEALENTIKLLNDPSQRQTFINDNDGAKKADAMAQQLMGDGADLQAIYKVAGEIFRKVANDGKGDPVDMMDTLSKAQQNPEAFFNNLSPEHKKMIQELGKKAKERKQNKVNNP